MKTELILEYGTKLIVLFMCIPIHEFAHAWSATKLGDDTPRYQGRLTLNPLAHLDLWGSLCILFVGFGWGKPVSVNPLNFKEYRKGMAITASAGPISNLICAFGGVIIYKVLVCMYITNFSVAIFWTAQIFYWITTINIGLAVFNLIPIYPLDGQKIFAYFASSKINRFFETYQNYIAIGFIVLMISGVLNEPIGYIQRGTMWIMDKLTFWVDPILSAIIN